MTAPSTLAAPASRAFGRLPDGLKTLSETGLLGGWPYSDAARPLENLVTIGAVEMLRQVGMQEKIALVGFGDSALADIPALAGRR